jgi:hypothetical protein
MSQVGSLKIWCVLLKRIRVPVRLILASVIVLSATIQTKLEEENLFLLCNSICRWPFSSQHWNCWYCLFRRTMQRRYI